MAWTGPEPSRWRSWPQAMRLVTSPAMLRRTVLIALVVGTILSIVNQAYVVSAGRADSATWMRIGANYVVPFLVSNAGAFAATRDLSDPTNSSEKETTDEH